MAFDYRDGAGNCPPNYYRPAVGYDCRPVTSGAFYQQQDLSAVAAHYVDDSSTAANTTRSTGAPAQSFYTAQPPVTPMVQAPVASGGFDTITLLLIGVAAFLLLKK